MRKEREIVKASGEVPRRPHYDYLTSPYAGQYTPDQAQHAVDTVYAQ